MDGVDITTHCPDRYVPAWPWQDQEDLAFRVLAQQMGHVVMGVEGLDKRFPALAYDVDATLQDRIASVFKRAAFIMDGQAEMGVMRLLLMLTQIDYDTGTRAQHYINNGQNIGAVLDDRGNPLVNMNVTRFIAGIVFDIIRPLFPEDLLARNGKPMHDMSNDELAHYLAQPHERLFERFAQLPALRDKHLLPMLKQAIAERHLEVGNFCAEQQLIFKSILTQYRQHHGHGAAGTGSTKS
jgi:hypothetical protein